MHVPAAAVVAVRRWLLPRGIAEGGGGGGGGGGVPANDVEDLPVVRRMKSERKLLKAFRCSLLSL